MWSKRKHTMAARVEDTADQLGRAASIGAVAFGAVAVVAVMALLLATLALSEPRGTA